MPFGIKELRDGRPFNWDSHYEQVIARSIHEIGMTPIRADDIYGPQPLMERVWRGIQEAEIVVADLTGRNPNVLYELGLAHMIWKRVILLTMDQEDIPIDLAPYVYIKYSDQGTGIVTLMDDLKKNLSAARAEPRTEAGLYPLPGGGVELIPVTVVAVMPKFLLVETRDGRRSILDADDISWTRKYDDLTGKFQVGELLDGAFVVGINGERRYSLKAVKENPWDKLKSEFLLEKSFVGTVVNHPPGKGAFVRMNYNINGRIPESMIQNVNLDKGDEVEVITDRIDPSQYRVDLRFIRKVRPSEGQEQEEEQLPYSVGQRFEGTIVNISLQKGFALVRLPDEFTAILHVVNMSKNLRNGLEKGDFQVGSPLAVAIARIDKQRNKVYLRNIDSEQDSG